MYRINHKGLVRPCNADCAGTLPHIAAHWLWSRIPGAPALCECTQCCLNRPHLSPKRTTSGRTKHACWLLLAVAVLAMTVLKRPETAACCPGLLLLVPGGPAAVANLGRLLLHISQQSGPASFRMVLVRAICGPRLKKGQECFAFMIRCWVKASMVEQPLITDQQQYIPSSNCTGGYHGGMNEEAHCAVQAGRMLEGYCPSLLL